MNVEKMRLGGNCHNEVCFDSCFGGASVVTRDERCFTIQDVVLPAFPAHNLPNFRACENSAML